MEDVDENSEEESNVSFSYTAPGGKLVRVKLMADRVGLKKLLEKDYKNLASEVIGGNKEDDMNRRSQVNRDENAVLQSGPLNIVDNNKEENKVQDGEDPDVSKFISQVGKKRGRHDDLNAMSSSHDEDVVMRNEEGLNQNRG